MIVEEMASRRFAEASKRVSIGVRSMLVMCMVLWSGSM